MKFATYPSLKNKSVLVTGGASGIGAEIVRAFAEQGAKVGFIDLDNSASEDLITSTDGTIEFECCDLRDIDASFVDQLCSDEHVLSEYEQIACAYVAGWLEYKSEGPMCDDDSQIIDGKMFDFIEEVSFNLNVMFKSVLAVKLFL